MTTALPDAPTRSPVDVPEVLEHLRAVVAEVGPDYRYECPVERQLDTLASVGLVGRCVYAHDDCPSCIIGRVFARLGVPIEEIAALDDPDWPLSISGLWHKGALPLPMTNHAVAVLTAAQRIQDTGASAREGDTRWTWGVALELAEEVAVNGPTDPHEAYVNAASIHARLIPQR